jgi:hypothetical protein
MGLIDKPLKNNKNLITEMFITEEANDYSIYCIRVYKNGKKTFILLDDYFPIMDGC